MKRILAAAGLVLALGLGIASAQNITRSLQGAQDPRGPVGIDTSNSAYFPGHINAFGQNTQAVSVFTGCGTNGNSSGVVVKNGSTDVAGQVTPGASSCSIQFGSPFNAAPFCVITPTTGTSGQSFAITTATTGFNLASVVSGSVYNYVCIGNQ